MKQTIFTLILLLSAYLAQAQILSLYVTNNQGSPVNGAWVSIPGYKLVKNTTSASGRLMIDLQSLGVAQGTRLNILVTATNYEQYNNNGYAAKAADDTLYIALKPAAPEASGATATPPQAAPDSDAAWRSAQQRNTEEAYLQFMIDFPQSKYGPEAQKRRDALKNKRESIQKQQEQAQNDRLEQLKRQAADLDAWQTALQLNTEQGYARYVANFPNGEYSTQARTKINDMKRRRAEEEAARLRQEELRKQEAANIQLADDNAWAIAKQKNTVEAYQAYQSKQPQGKYLAEAKQKIDELAKQAIEAEKAKKTLPQKQDLVPEPEMVLVQGGTFVMGCLDNRDLDCAKKGDVYMAHTVTVASFYIGKYEVTQKQWKALMNNNPAKNQECDNCPIENVSWEDAQQYVKKLSELTGRTYRLPTEAEWEFAARGGNESRKYVYSGGSEWKLVSWCRSMDGLTLGKTGTRPTGQKQPNELGLFDMSGNVWEWCEDWHSDNFYTLSMEATNPLNQRPSEFRVLRGGSWNDKADVAQNAYRSGNRPESRDAATGFRVALTASH